MATPKRTHSIDAVSAAVGLEQMLAQPWWHWERWLVRWWDLAPPWRLGPLYLGGHRHGNELTVIARCARRWLVLKLRATTGQEP